MTSSFSLYPPRPICCGTCFRRLGDDPDESAVPLARFRLRASSASPSAAALASAASRCFLFLLLPFRAFNVIVYSLGVALKARLQANGCTDWSQTKPSAIDRRCPQCTRWLAVGHRDVLGQRCRLRVRFAPIFALANHCDCERFSSGATRLVHSDLALRDRDATQGSFPC